MSVGSGGVRVYRVGEPGKESPRRVKYEKPVRFRKAAKQSPLNSQNERASHTTVDARSRQLEPVRVRHKLVLNQKQRERLEALFRAPRALASLLRQHPQKLVTPTDASNFLLSNRRELDGYINPDVRHRAVDLLTDLLINWSGTPPESIGIDFEDVSLTSDHRVFLPLQGLRGVDVADSKLLEKQRRGRRFKQPFTLFEEDSQFFIAFTLEPKVPSSQHSKVKNFVVVPKEIHLKPGQPLPYINGLRHQHREPTQRVLYSRYSRVFSGGLRSMNWGGLSGREVLGGLPSLGRRSR